MAAVFDREGDHSLVIIVGGDGTHRIHSWLIHIHMRDGKLWVQRHGTEHGIQRELAALASHSPEKRPYTGYAVA